MFIKNLWQKYKKKCFLSFFITLSIYWLYGYFYKGLIKGNANIMYKKNDKQMENILNLCPSLKEKYIPTFWAHSSYFQLFLLVIHEIFHKNTCLFEQHILKTKDNGQVCCDIYKEPKGQELPLDAPICLFLHTITGNSNSCSEFIKYSFSRGFRPIVLNRRGHFNKLSSPKYNIMGDVEDTKLMIDYIDSLYPSCKFIGAIGISAGSGQLVSYIGHQKLNKPVQAAVSLCPAYDMENAFKNWNIKHPILARYLLRSLKQLFLHENYELLYSSNNNNFKKCLHSTSVHDFIVNSVHFAGFTSFNSYLEHSNPMKHYSRNKIPCLILNSKDDPICLEKNICYDLATNTQNYALILTEYGSHIAYREGLFGQKSYMFKLSIDFLQASMIYLNKK